MTIDALQLKDYFVEAGLENQKAELMAKGVRDVIKNSELVTKEDINKLRVDLERMKLQIIGGSVTIQTIIIALFEIFKQ